MYKHHSTACPTGLQSIKQSVFFFPPIQEHCFIHNTTCYIQQWCCLPQWSARLLKPSSVVFSRKDIFRWEHHGTVSLRLNYGCDICPDWQPATLCVCGYVFCLPCGCVCVYMYTCLCLCSVGPSGSNVIEQEALSAQVDEMCKEMASQTWW